MTEARELMGRFLRRGRRSAVEEVSLLVRARERPSLFGEFYEAEHEQVLAYFAREALDPETAFDLMAETFAAAFDGLDQFRGSTDREGYAWLWSIARHQLYRWRERGVVERRALHRLGVQLPVMETSEYERIEELADLDRCHERVVDSLELLPEDQRVAVEMRVVDELAYAEIAERLGVTEQVVRARVSRGLRRLASSVAVPATPPGQRER